jgi:hypothetical protein
MPIVSMFVKTSFSREEHPVNAYVSMLFTPPQSETDFKDEQPENANFPIECVSGPIKTEVTAVSDSQLLSPIEVMPSPKVMLLISEILPLRFRSFFNGILKGAPVSASSPSLYNL